MTSDGPFRTRKRRRSRDRVGLLGGPSTTAKKRLEAKTLFVFAILHWQYECENYEIWDIEQTVYEESNGEIQIKIRRSVLLLLCQCPLMAETLIVIY